MAKKNRNSKTPKAAKATAKTLRTVAKFLDGNTVNVQGQQSSTSANTGGATNFGVSKMAAPLAMAGRQSVPRSKFAGQKTDVLCGTQKIGNLKATAAGAVEGTILFQQDVRLDSISNNRLALYSRLYSKWRIRKWLIRYVPSCPATTPGQLAIFVEPDPDITYIDGNPSNAQNAAEHVNNVVANAWEQVVLPYRLADRDRAELYTNTLGLEPRTDCAGQMLVVAMTTLTADLVLGTLFVDYDIEFTQPNTQISALTSPSGAYVSSGGTVSNAKPLGTAPNIFWNTIGVDPKAGDNIKFPNSNIGDRFNALFLVDGTSTPQYTVTARNLKNLQSQGISTTIGLWFLYSYEVTNTDGDGLAPRLSFTCTTGNTEDLYIHIWSMPSGVSVSSLRGRKLQSKVAELTENYASAMKRIDSLTERLELMSSDTRCPGAGWTKITPKGISLPPG